MKNFIKLEETESTNTFLKKNIDKYRAPSLVYANKQTAGKGRYTRKWLAIPKKDLTFSMLIDSDKKHCELWQNISQIISLAICEFLEELQLNPQIKWPNDILINNKKICGILVEAVQDSDKVSCHLIIGIGLNVNSSAKELSVIDQPATSIYEETKHQQNLTTVLEKVYKKSLSYNEILHTNGFLPFKDEIESRMAYIGENKTVTDGINDTNGYLSGLNNNGTLIFRTESGEIMNITSGEIRFSKS